MKLVEQYKEDREHTRSLMLATLERDSVPQEMIADFLECYDAETKVGHKIAEWLDANRDSSAD